jgi:hypothetical protein
LPGKQLVHIAVVLSPFTQLLLGNEYTCHIIFGFYARNTSDLFTLTVTFTVHETEKFRISAFQTVTKYHSETLKERNYFGKLGSRWKAIIKMDLTRIVCEYVGRPLLSRDNGSVIFQNIITFMRRQADHRSDTFVPRGYTASHPTKYHCF